MTELTKEDVTVFVLVGGYCLKCKVSPQHRNNWGYYCYSCWEPLSVNHHHADREEWTALLNLWQPALAKWAKLK